jgi:hypothetical protein
MSPAAHDIGDTAMTQQLSDQTLDLIEEVIAVTGARLTIYAEHSWALEGNGRLAFDPAEDSRHLRDELRRIIARKAL